MAKGYSKDLRERVVAMVEDGESRREVARVLDLAPSTAVRWLERWTTTGTGSWTRRRASTGPGSQC